MYVKWETTMQTNSDGAKLRIGEHGTPKHSSNTNSREKENVPCGTGTQSFTPGYRSAELKASS